MRTLLLAALLLAGLAARAGASKCEQGRFLWPAGSFPNWQTISLSQTFDDPIVVVGPVTRDNDLEELIGRVRSITSTSFQLGLVRNTGTTSAAGDEYIGWLVCEKGTWTLGTGQYIEAGIATESNTFSTPTVTLAGSYLGTPVIMPCWQTANDPRYGTLRLRSESETSFQLVSEIVSGEQVGYIAIQQGSISGLLDAGTTGDTVNHNYHTITFFQTFTGVPALLGSITFDGSHDSTLRLGPTYSPSTVQVWIEEDLDLFGNGAHTSEEVYYLAIEPTQSFFSLSAAPDPPRTEFTFTEQHWLFGSSSAYIDGALLEIPDNNRFRNITQVYSPADLQTIDDNIRSIIPSMQRIQNNQFADELLTGDTYLVFTEDTVCEMTFLFEGAGYQNALGYIAWNSLDVSIPNPTTDRQGFLDWASDNDAYVIPFPRVDDTIIALGDTIRLEYNADPGNPASVPTTNFPEGAAVVFFLLPNAYGTSSGANQASSGSFSATPPSVTFDFVNIIFSIDNLNDPDAAASFITTPAGTIFTKERHVVTYTDATVLPNAYIYGFEDIRRTFGGDEDMEDVAFLINVLEGNVANDDNIVSTAELGFPVATASPTPAPTVAPTDAPSGAPTATPSAAPSAIPTARPTQQPTFFPTPFPTTAPPTEPPTFPSKY